MINPLDWRLLFGLGLYVISLASLATFLAWIQAGLQGYITVGQAATPWLVTGLVLIGLASRRHGSGSTDQGK